jgi:hypothetical protein
MFAIKLGGCGRLAGGAGLFRFACNFAGIVLLGRRNLILLELDKPL